MNGKNSIDIWCLICHHINMKVKYYLFKFTGEVIKTDGESYQYFHKNKHIWTESFVVKELIRTNKKYKRLKRITEKEAFIELI